MSAQWAPPAMFGGSLKGSKPLRYIYVDEAGISAAEPVTVVVGIIVDADRQWKLAEEAVNNVLQTVPEHFRPGFHFHAMSVWGNPKYRDGWERDDRLALIRAMCRLPRHLGLPIALGKVRRDAEGAQQAIDQWRLPFSVAQWQHMQAFSQCMIKADTYIRERCPEYEVATVVAEDIPEMRTALRQMFAITKAIPAPGYLFELRPTIEEQKTGVMKQRVTVGIERIKDGVHFASKNDSPLLQIADACAFAFRRFFSEQSLGEELVQEVLGEKLPLEDWLGPMSGGLFPFRTVQAPS